jgi:hypothetical protein
MTGYSLCQQTDGPVQAARLLDLLLEKDGINPNPRDNNGRTPLARSCLHTIMQGALCSDLCRGHTLRDFMAIVRSLLSHRDIDPNAVDNNGVSILALFINTLTPYRTFWEDFGDDGREMWEEYENYGREIESLLRAAGAS